MAVLVLLIHQVQSTVSVQLNQQEVMVKQGDEIELICSSNVEALSCSFQSPKNIHYNMLKGAR